MLAASPASSQARILAYAQQFQRATWRIESPATPARSASRALEVCEHDLEHMAVADGKCQRTACYPTVAHDPRRHPRTRRTVPREPLPAEVAIRADVARRKPQLVIDVRGVPRRRRELDHLE